jgi:coenzyme F420-0:L-glutamate ligase/coenzyme F420-1:gamma-L-glutamate ligase
LAGRAEDAAPFGAPASADELAEAVTAVTGLAPERDGGTLVVKDADPVTLRALAFAFGWTLADSDGPAHLQPRTP